jgi:hypothetical protein
MAITFVAYASANGSAAVTPAMPTGATTNDLLICFIEGEGEDANADNMTDTGAWTSGGTVASGTTGAGDKTRLTWWWAWYSAGINRQVADAGQHTGAVLTAWRGVDATTPFDGVTPLSTSDGTNDTAANFVGITTGTDNAAVIFATSAGDNPGTAHPASIGFSSWANGDLTGFAEVVDVGGPAGSDWSIGIAWGIDTTAGTVAAATATIGASEESASWTIALRPAGPEVPTLAHQKEVLVVPPPHQQAWSRW